MTDFVLHADADSDNRPETTARHVAESVQLPTLLQEAAGQVGAMGEEFGADRHRILALHERLREERCHLAVLGQFKRGKSTLINALLGAPVLPAAVVPVTSIPTFLHGGEQPAARVVFENGKPEERLLGPDAAALAGFLARFVAESANPRNHLGVRLIEAAYPAPVLRRGLSLIDTPGIGSTFRHNTEATVNFLPQCDAAMFVVSADPPITEVEVEFLKLARRKLARLFFILNKVDYLDAAERDEAVRFLQRALCEHVGFTSPPPIFCASARQGLAARQGQDDAAWERSGVAAIEEQIVSFLLTEKKDVLSRAVARQAGDILADVQHRLELTLRSLQMPLADLDDRIGRFENSLTEIEERRIVALDRLARDEQRLAEAVKMRADAMLPGSIEFFTKVLRECEIRDGNRWSEETAREAIAAAIPGFFEREFGAAHQLCERELHEALRPHQRRAAELVAAVHASIAKVFDVPYEPQHREIALAKVEQPCWRVHKWAIQGPGSIPTDWIDRVLPRRLRHSRIRRRLADQVEYLVTRNIGDLRWSTLENLRTSIQDFRDALEDSLRQTIEATRRALGAARRRRTEDSATVAPEIARLEAAVAGLRGLKERLATTAAREQDQR